MAQGKINLQANDGKVAGIVFEDGASSNVTVTVPKEGGVVATEAYADTKVSKTGDETIAGVKTFSSNTIFNENVGIGISDPKSKLSIFAGGGWSSFNFGKQLYLTTNGLCNPCIGISDVNGVNNISIANSNGTIKFSAMPSITDSGTPPIDRLVIDTSGNVLVTGVGGLGYGTGAGGTVTQLTSKSTAVTLNKPTGQITMNNEALASNSSVAFTVNNSSCSAYDIPITSVSNNYNYSAICIGSGSGVFVVRVTNLTGGSLSESLIVNFAIIKGANS